MRIMKKKHSLDTFILPVVNLQEHFLDSGSNACDRTRYEKSLFNVLSPFSQGSVNACAYRQNAAVMSVMFDLIQLFQGKYSNAFIVAAAKSMIRTKNDGTCPRHLFLVNPYLTPPPKI